MIYSGISPLVDRKGDGARTIKRQWRRRGSGRRVQDSAAKLGFEAKLWQAADALRNNMDAAEYKHVVLGLIFLKYISDAFEAKHAELAAQRAEGADPEDPDEYRAENIFWVPPEARWSYLKGAAPQPTIGQIVDDAMAAIERDNPSLKGVLPRSTPRPGFGDAGGDASRASHRFSGRRTGVRRITLDDPRPAVSLSGSGS
jgi:HsdM N-terminal domain